MTRYLDDISIPTLDSTVAQMDVDVGATDHGEQPIGTASQSLS